MKALSIKQPWASLIANGIKDIENRTWKTKFRGRIYIHASGQYTRTKIGWELLTEEQFKSLDKETLVKHLDKSFPTSAIIGEVDIIDYVINHPSIWAESTATTQSGDEVVEKPIYNWVLANPVLYDKPILNVKGNLSFWEFRDLIECSCCTNKETDEEMHICERCEQEYCIDCQAGFNQFSQIDYNCCEKCANTNNQNDD